MKKKLYIETYGCQMNVADSEVVASILSDEYVICTDEKEADVILVNTCAIRENAEQKVLKRIQELNVLYRKKQKKVKLGLIGCMAERFSTQLLKEDKVDIIAGPDAYRSLPILLDENEKDNVNTVLSTVETYDDIIPIRYASNGVAAFVSIMRGCNNFVLIV